jgi:hypothetical protein
MIKLKILFLDDQQIELIQVFMFMIDILNEGFFEYELD